MTVKTKKILATVLNAVLGIIEIIVLWKFVELAPVVASIIGVVTMTLTELGINLDVTE